MSGSSSILEGKCYYLKDTLDDGDFLDGNANESIGNFEGQGQPPYQPPPGQPYHQDPYGLPPQYPPQQYGPPPGAPLPRQQTAKPLFAGILLILFGLINIGFAIYLIVAIESVFSLIPDMAQAPLDFIRNIVVMCGVIIIILNLIVILGGYFATRRTNFGIAIIGAIVGLFTIGPFCLSSIVALIALILIYMSKDEFT
jgi:hypothetical protein